MTDLPVLPILDAARCPRRDRLTTVELEGQYVVGACGHVVRVRDTIFHGTYSGYQRGCRCASCREANALRMRASRAAARA